MLLAGAYSVVTPAFETPDEIWHFAYIHHLHTERALPVSAPQTTALWRQQGVQAPGYYLAVALLTAWVDASDFPTIYDRANPHAAIGRPGTADNRNYLVHHFPEESFPWRGVFLALHLARFLSVLLAAVTLWAVYGLLAPLVGERLALLATAGLAFTPQFLFVSAAASNDNAINAAAALVLWQLTRLLTGPAQRWRSWRAWGLLGVFLGAALLAKLSGLALVGVVGAAALWMAWRVRSFRLLVRAALACGLPALVLAGWWYVRNWRLYGDPLAWNIWQQNILLRVIPADWRTILAELESLERSYWGLFGWFNVPYPEWVYWAFRGVEVMVALGLLAALLRGVCPEKKDRTRMPRIRRIFTDQKGRMDFHRADAAPICTILPFAVIYAFFHSPRRTESAWGSALKNRIERGRHGSG
ncbi:MAG: phospholipid carrier-dependent glycosyltransferase, partial [Caldilineae bacterium]